MPLESIRLGKAIRGSLVIYVLGAALAILTQILLARLMGATEYGIYYYALSWLVIISMVSQAGFDQALLRFMPSFVQNRDWPRAAGILRMGNRLILGNAIVIGLVMALFVFSFQDHLSESQRDTLLIAACCLPLRGLIYLRQATLRSFLYTVRSLLPEAVITPVVLVTITFVASLAGQASSATLVMTAMLAAISISYLVGAYWQSRLIPVEIHQQLPILETSTWLKVAFMLLIINGAHTLLNNTDLLILGVYRQASEVGIYGVCSRIAATVTFLLLATYPVLAPVFARDVAGDAGADLQTAIAKIMRPIAVVSTVLALSLIFLSESFLSLFGETFRAGTTVLSLLVIGQLINTLCGPVALLSPTEGAKSSLPR